mgnify:CR=1 FL=1
MKKILNLVVTKRWFDMIASGEKTEEYREIKGFWLNRLLLIKDEGGEKFRKLHVGNNDAILIDAITIKKEIDIGTLKVAPFTHVLFRNGYHKYSPRIEKEIKTITFGKPKKGMCPDEWLAAEFIIIKFK